MPWEKVDPVNERLHFVVEARLGRVNFSQLCREYGVSRKTGYKWLKRFEEEGCPDFSDRSRVPLSCPHKTAPEMVRKVLELKEEYPYWGPKKLAVLLASRVDSGPSPVASTIGKILKEHGLVKRRQRKRKSAGRVRTANFREAKAPNDVWAVDYKGWFRTRDGKPCHPLTVTDLYSRNVLWCGAHPAQSLDHVADDFSLIFRRYGYPSALRMDNGTPFGSTGLGGLTRLSVDWLLRGITLEFIEPGKPQQNGCHERMHRSLKLEATLPPGRDLTRQQWRFDEWRRRFNEVRPHEALKMRTPSSMYTASELEEAAEAIPHYPDYFETRFVRRDGMFSWEGRLRFVGEAFGRKNIGLIRDHEDRLLVFIGDHLLGWLPNESVRVDPLQQ